MNLSRLKVGTQLAGGFGVLALALVAVGTLAVFRLGTLNDAVKHLATEEWPAARTALEIDTRQRDNFARVGQLLLTDSGATKNALDQIQSNRLYVSSAFQRLAVLLQHQEARTLLARVEPVQQRFLAELANLEKAVAEGDREAAARLYVQKVVPALDEAMRETNSLVAFQDREFAKEYQLAGDLYLEARSTLWLAVVIALLAGGVLAMMVARNIVRPLKQAATVASAIAAGKLDSAIEVRGEDETAMLLSSLSRMQESLRERDSRELDSRGLVAAIDASQAVIAFDMDGKILDANDNFLRTLGYSLAEIRGQHHSLFVEPAAVNSPEYRAFWQKLGRGEFDAGQYKRIGKNGREVWIQASYTPIRDVHGKPFKVVKFATDITEQKLRNADFEGQLAAIQKAQAVIEFELDGTVRHANDNFLKTLGYSLGEIRGQHHRMFVEPSVAASAEYQAFWQKLGRGEYETGQYKRLTKSGREIWIQASYNPIFDASGKPVKVVKYASDVTAQVLFSQQLQTAVQEIQDAVTNAINGNLKLRVTTSGRTGELESLCSGVNSLLDAVATMVRSVKNAAAEVRVGAEEISKGNLNLSQRTEEQASSLEETASSMEQMTSTVKQTADNAGQANQLALAARQQAEKGGAVVGAAVQAMGGINEASRKISDIISVIDEIAFQTNLLALNAAVEAARAGEQGRGFAVVATEVRNLAGRSATAAKEIKGLIQDSVARVEEGSKLVDESGQTLEGIVAAVKKVTDIVAEIASASREQSSGIEQVNKAVMQMDTTTQQNAALVEQAAAASQSIVEQAQTLHGLIARYDVGDGTSVAAPAAPSSPSPSDSLPSERRKAGRPWSKPASAPAAKPAAASVPRKLAAGGDALDWQEF